MSQGVRTTTAGSVPVGMQEEKSLKYHLMPHLLVPNDPRRRKRGKKRRRKRSVRVKTQ